MKKIDPRNVKDLNSAIGKQCSVTFGFSNQECHGVLTNIQVHTVTGELGVIINTGEMAIRIPIRDISVLEIEE
jgi:hypothetical protein